jgi:penicillin-binding protein 1B
MTSMMKDVVNRGTAARLRSRGFKFNVAGKTGTSRDGWFAGYTPQLVCVVYVGFDDGSPLGLTGADSALPIWADFMQAALSAHPEWAGDWQQPSGLEQASIDTRTGMLAAADNTTSKRTELFIQGTAPTQESTAPLEDELAPLDGEGEEGGEFDYAPAPVVVPSDGSDPPPLPAATPKPLRTTPRLEGRGITQADGTSRLMGTITLDIDPATGLLAAPTCPVIRSKTFPIGQEPRRYCGPGYHNGKTILPSGTRPRVVSP